MPKTVKIKEEVFCTLQIEGTHNWPGCPFKEVAYLKHSHRHVFHIKAFKTVTHDDRDVEFIMLKHKINKHFHDNHFNDMSQMMEFGPMSCEMIAKELITKFNLSRCEVSEDGENGAIVTVECELNEHELH